MSADFWFQTTGGTANPALIGNSLKFHNGNSRLSRTMVSGNRQTWTYSVWIKYPIKTANHAVILSAGNSTSAYDNIRINTSGHTPSNCLSWYDNGSAYQELNRKMRDPNGWYHIVLVWDTNNGNANDRRRMYINGVRQTDFYRNSNPGQGSSSVVNSNVTHYIGSLLTQIYSENLDGTLAEIHFVDGAALDPTAFGAEANGSWVPIRANVPAYGANGFYLDFSDPNNIGADRSGRGNNFSPTGFELSNTSSHDYAWCDDSPSNNGSRPNSLDVRNSYVPEFTNANDKVKHRGGTGQYSHSAYNLTFPSNDPEGFYMEIQNEAQSLGGASLIVKDISVRELHPDVSNGFSTNTRGGIGYDSNGYIRNFGSTIDRTSNGSWNSNGTVLGIAVKENKIWFSINNSWIDGNPSTGTSPTITLSSDQIFRLGSYGQGSRIFNNLAQLKYPLPTGFKSLNSGNLPETIADPSDHFQVVHNTGPNILNSAISTFSDGLYIIKDRANSSDWKFVDTMRGTGTQKLSPSTTTSSYGPPAGNSVAYCWNAPESYSPSLVNLTRLSAQRNVEAGFCMVRYTGQGSAGQIAHGLGRAPKFIIVIDERGGQAIHCGHAGMDKSNPWNYTMSMHSGSGRSSNAAWQSKAPDANNIYLNTPLTLNTVNYCLYAWAEIPGFSSFSESPASGVREGAFISMGLNPALFIYKPYNATANWGFRDHRMSPYNPNKTYMYCNGTNGEYTSALEMDVCCNGVKWKEDGGQGNNGGQEVIYMAWALHPAGGSNVYPSPAR